MNIFQKALRKFVLTEEERATLRNPSSWLQDTLGAGKTDAGVSVTEEHSMRIGAVYACVRVLSESVASLPLHVYRREGDKRTLADNHPLYKLLHSQPNREMTSFQWREVMMAYLTLWGNAYSQIERDSQGRIVALWPIHPGRVLPERTKTGDIRYRVTMNGKTVYIRFEDMLHIPALGFDGLVGASPIQLARQSLGLSVAAEKFGARYFGQGTNLGGFIKHPSNITKPAQERLKEQIAEQHKGLDNSHGILLLEEGMEFSNVAIPPEDSQFIETRKFQVTEIARIFRVPPHMIADLDRATFSNIEHQGIEFVQHTLRPWLVRWEQQLKMKLLPRSDVFAEFNVDGLLRGDTESRYKAYATARQNGWMSANDIRRLENQDPLPSEIGDVYLTPKNMDASNDKDKGEETA